MAIAPKKPFEGPWTPQGPDRLHALSSDMSPTCLKFVLRRRVAEKDPATARAMIRIGARNNVISQRGAIRGRSESQALKVRTSGSSNAQPGPSFFIVHPAAACESACQVLSEVSEGCEFIISFRPGPHACLLFITLSICSLSGFIKRGAPLDPYDDRLQNLSPPRRSIHR